MIGAVARRDAAAQSQRPRYALTRRGPRLSKASLPE
jgi:DNA-binding HxlR family transcriptional regulator